MRPHPLLLPCCAAALGLTAATFAQAQSSTNGQWLGTAGAGLAVTSGNSNTTNVSLNTDLSRSTQRDKISVGGFVNYGRSKVDGVSTDTANKWNAFGQYDLNLSERIFSFGRLAAEGDRLVHLNLRYTLTGGPGYRVVNTDANKFNVMAGAAYSHDSYNVQQTLDGRVDKRFSRVSLFVGEESSHQISATTLVRQRLDVYPGVTGDKALIAKLTAGLAVSITRTLSLTVDLLDTYNSRPPARTKGNDLSLMTGISLKLGAP